MNSHKLKNDRKKGEAKSCIIHCLIAERLNISCVLIKQHTGLLFFCPFLCVNIDYVDNDDGETRQSQFEY